MAADFVTAEESGTQSCSFQPVALPPEGVCAVRADSAARPRRTILLSEP